MWNTVKNYLHGLHGFVANSQKFVVCNRPRENPKRSKFPWSKLQTVCTKLYSYIVLYYAKFGVKSGKSQLETKLGPKYKCNIQNYKVFVLPPKIFVTEDYFLCLPMCFQGMRQEFGSAGAKGDVLKICGFTQYIYYSTTSLKISGFKR